MQNMKPGESIARLTAFADGKNIEERDRLAFATALMMDVRFRGKTLLERYPGEPRRAFRQGQAIVQSILAKAGDDDVWKAFIEGYLPWIRLGGTSSVRGPSRTDGSRTTATPRVS